MAAYMIVELTVNNPEGMGEYREKVSDTVLAHGGKYLFLTNEVKVLEGNVGQHPMKVGLEFPSEGRRDGLV